MVDFNDSTRLELYLAINYVEPRVPVVKKAGATKRAVERGEVRKRGIINAPHSINGVIVAVIVNLNARRLCVESDSSVGRVDVSCRVVNYTLILGLQSRKGKLNKRQNGSKIGTSTLTKLRAKIRRPTKGLEGVG